MSVNGIPATNICTDNGTGVSLEGDGVVVTLPNGKTITTQGDNFTLGDGSGNQIVLNQNGAVIPPGHQPYGVVDPASQEEVANVVQSYGNTDGTHRNSTSGSDSSSGSTGGSKWASELDRIYGELENSDNLDTKEMEKLQRELQRALQMFQLLMQMMTAIFEAKKDAGRQIRY